MGVRFQLDQLGRGGWFDELVYPMCIEIMQLVALDERYSLAMERHGG